MQADMQPRQPEEIELVPFSDLDSRWALWSDLAARSGNIFATPEWARVWWRHFGGSSEASLFECRVDDRPFAILPLHEERRGPLRVLRLIGHGPGDVLGPVCDPADRVLAGRALREALDAADGPRLLLAERLAGEALPTALGGRVLQRDANPRLDIEGRTWEEYVSTRSRNVREKLRRSARKLERDHRVTYRLCENPAGLGNDMEILLRLHVDRWGERSNFARDSSVAFHRELTAALLERGWLRLWTMEVDREPAAAWYGFRFEGTESFYQSGRDRRFDRHSVGFLMLTRTMRAAFDDGLERYAFLRGDEPYKDRFASGDEGLQTQVVTRGGFAAALAGGGSVALRWPPLRRRITAAMRRGAG
ncbi:MAG TPA: GNAT family N-acetyltransferase [Solirubrobacterales bacterium]|nr:GNAT family N-acetyltransferase [Solirubrobacterales bacterium]